MTAKQRAKKIRAHIHDPKNCGECGGTGTTRGRKPGTRYSGCATCAVGNTMTMMSPKDVLWLLKRAGL